jgi:hypothetical protein
MARKKAPLHFRLFARFSLKEDLERMLAGAPGDRHRFPRVVLDILRAEGCEVSYESHERWRVEATLLCGGLCYYLMISQDTSPPWSWKVDVRRLYSIPKKPPKARAGHQGPEPDPGPAPWPLVSLLNRSFAGMVDEPPIRWVRELL